MIALALRVPNDDDLRDQLRQALASDGSDPAVPDLRQRLRELHRKARTKLLGHRPVLRHPEARP